MLISTSLFSQNPPYPCGTWQQNGTLYNGELYPGPVNGYHHPKNPNDTWIFTDTRTGFNSSSRGWYYLQCGPTDVSINGAISFLLFVVLTTVFTVGLLSKRHIKTE